jgi:hypothetical protein
MAVDAVLEQEGTLGDERVKWKVSIIFEISVNVAPLAALKGGNFPNCRSPEFRESVLTLFSSPMSLSKLPFPWR